MVATALIDYLKQEMDGSFDTLAQAKVEAMQAKLGEYPSARALVSPGNVLYDATYAAERQDPVFMKSVNSVKTKVEQALAPIRIGFDPHSARYQDSKGFSLEESFDLFLKFWELEASVWQRNNGQDKRQQKHNKRQRDLVFATYSSFMIAHLGIGNCSHRAAFAAFELVKILGAKVRVGLVNAPRRDQYVVVIGPKDAQKNSSSWMVYDPLNNPYMVMPRREYKSAVLSLYRAVFSNKVRFKLALNGEDVEKQQEMIPRIADFYKKRCPDSNDTDNTPVEYPICGMG